MADENSSIVVTSEEQQLVGENNSEASLGFGHPRFCIFLSVLAVLLLAHGLVIYFIYFWEKLNRRNFKWQTYNNIVYYSLLSKTLWIQENVIWQYRPRNMPHTKLPNTRHYVLKSVASKLLKDAWNGLKSRIFFGHSLGLCLVFIILIILATNGFNYYAYFKCWLLSNSCHELKIISLNVWGTPKLLGGGDFKNNRMEAIGNLIAQG